MQDEYTITITNEEELKKLLTFTKNHLAIGLVEDSPPRKMPKYTKTSLLQEVCTKF
jgi:hypothetical protein